MCGTNTSTLLTSQSIGSIFLWYQWVEFGVRVCTCRMESGESGVHWMYSIWYWSDKHDEDRMIPLSISIWRWALKEINSNYPTSLWHFRQLLTPCHLQRHTSIYDICVYWRKKDGAAYFSNSLVFLARIPHCTNSKSAQSEQKIHTNEK